MTGVGSASVAFVLLASLFFLHPPSAVLLSGQSRPLPDPDAFYRAVQEKLERAEELADLYVFKERRTDIHTNPFGRIGTGGTRLFEVYPSPTRGLTYRREIARDGVPVAPEELARQDREYRARAADLVRRMAAENPDALARRDLELTRARERAQERIRDVVGALQFRMDRREISDGVPAIVITFVPRAGARPTTRHGRIAHNFKGTVWVHEAASEVMRLEAISIDDISWGFGLIARIGEGTTASLTRREVEPGVWMPTELRLKGRGRAAVFRSLVIDFAVDWFDYRRHPVDSAIPFP